MYVYMYVYVIYVCMYVCMYVYGHEGLSKTCHAYRYVCMYVHMYMQGKEPYADCCSAWVPSMHTYMYLCVISIYSHMCFVYVCKHVLICIYGCVYTCMCMRHGRTRFFASELGMHGCMHACVYVHVYFHCQCILFIHTRA
jgi:hypothetical protein